VYISSQPGTGPARSEAGQERKFQPYGTHRARATEFAKAGEDPLSLAPPNILSVGLPTIQLYGGKSETTTDAEANKKYIDEVPVSGF
jgi:hypothetical protein